MFLELHERPKLSVHSRSHCLSAVAYPVIVVHLKYTLTINFECLGRLTGASVPLLAKRLPGTGHSVSQCLLRHKRSALASLREPQPHMVVQVNVSCRKQTVQDTCNHRKLASCLKATSSLPKLGWLIGCKHTVCQQDQITEALISVIILLAELGPQQHFCKHVNTSCCQVSPCNAALC